MADGIVLNDFKHYLLCYSSGWRPLSRCGHADRLQHCTSRAVVKIYAPYPLRHHGARHWNLYDDPSGHGTSRGGYAKTTDEGRFMFSLSRFAMLRRLDFNWFATVLNPCQPGPSYGSILPVCVAEILTYCFVRSAIWKLFESLICLFKL